MPSHKKTQKIKSQKVSSDKKTRKMFVEGLSIHLFQKNISLYRLKESEVVISSPKVWKNGQKWPFLAVFCDKK